MSKYLLLCSACCAISIGASAADAQQKAVIEEIVVTAQKVRTNVQRTPIAIQTISGKTLSAAGVLDAKDLNRLVPGLSVQVGAGSGSSFYIRGVGNDNSTAINDNGIAVSIDQSYFSRGTGPDQVLYDLDRIEVLKGPQGTLYGRNATGGAINIISTKPTLDKLSGYGSAEFGNYGEVRFNGAINVPLSDTLAARVAFQTAQHDGYLTDGYNDLDNKAVRAHLLWKPNADLSVLMSGEFAHSGGKGQESLPLVNNQFIGSDPYGGGAIPGPIQSYIAALAPRSGNMGPGPYTIAPGTCFPGCIRPGLIQLQPGPYQVQNTGFVDNTLTSFRADIEYNLGFGTLSVIPTLLNTDYAAIFHDGVTPFFNGGKARQLSFETRLASRQDQRFTWIAGGFYEQEKQNFQFVGVLGVPFEYSAITEPDLQDRTGGVFAQGTYKILPNLSFTAGVRYSVEDKVTYDTSADNAALAFLPPFLSSHHFAAVNKESASAPTYRVGMDWQATPTNLLYSYYATGFHSGGLQQGLPATRPICNSDQLLADFRTCDNPGTYQPEHLDAIAIGSKNRFLDNRLQLNLEAYNWEYKNLQVGTIGVVNPGITAQRVQNAGSSRIRGVDIEGRAAITPDDQISVGLNYNDSQYGSLVFYNVILGVFASASTYTNQKFINSPSWTMTTNYSHTFNLANGATLTPSARVQYSSTVNVQYGPLVAQPSYAKLDLDLAYRSANGRYEVRAFARNVTNEATLVSAAALDQSTGLDYVNVSPPLTFGGSLTVNF